MELNDLTFAIRGAIFKVHNYFGPGLMECIYEYALIHELRKAGLEIRSQVGISVVYDSHTLPPGFRMDILVENKIIIEVKSVEKLIDLHKKQLLTYLRLTNNKLGILVNFNSVSLKEKESIFRIIN